MKTKKNILLGTQNAKTSKGVKLGHLTGILYLAPHTIGGAGNVCSFASKGCASACLYSAGRGAFTNVQKSRIRKTREFFANVKQFVEDLDKDISRVIRKADRENLIPCIRLNGTSDIPFEMLKGELGVSLMDRYPNVMFYDYTKNPNRMRNYLKGNFPSNYHLTFSRSECNNDVCYDMLKRGGSVAVVFRGDLPDTHGGYDVINGDDHDLRFLDKSNVIVGLKAKGDAKKDKGGFVI